MEKSKYNQEYPDSESSPKKSGERRNNQPIEMSTSGGGRGGRGVRGGSRSSQGRTNNHKPSVKKTVNDYVYYVGSSKQASDYEVTTEFLINHIKKTFDYGDDISAALSNLEPHDLLPFKPTLKFSTADEPNEKEAQNKQFEIEFKSDYDRYNIRVEAYKKNQGKAYAFLWERCSKGMKDKIQSRSDYSIQIKDNPIELLKAIKQHALNYQENRYEMAIVYDAMMSLHKTCQKEGESLQDYTKRFRVAKDVMESHIGGPIILTKIIKGMKEYSEDDEMKREKCVRDAYNQYMAYVYLQNADQSKYGSILRGLNTQQSLGNNQYPKTITEANNVLSNHRFDNNPSGARKNHAAGSNNNKSSEKKQENEDDSPSLSFTQMEG